MISLKRIFREVSSFKKIHTSAILNSHNTNRQVKILNKLIGEKVSGSKKRWYPTKEILPATGSLTNTKNSGKNSSRRVAVLNKLFMRHITDLLATGEASEEVVGKGLEISRVKVTSDFHGVHVYWIAKGDMHDDEMEAALHKCSGVLRHELSQLRLMGEVPKIRFVKDKFYANLAEVECILKKCDFGGDHRKIDASKMISDFTEYSGNNLLPAQIEDNTSEKEPLLKMRYDVFGLDHKKILDKIVIKMKKSRKAWEDYELNTQVILEGNEKKQITIKDVQRKLEESKMEEEAFEKFLKRKKFAKNTPERKKNYKYYDDCLRKAVEDVSFESSKDDGDYIEEYENR